MDQNQKPRLTDFSVNEPKRAGILQKDTGSVFINPVWKVGIDLKLKLDLCSWNCCELLDDTLNYLSHLMGGSVC